MKKGYLVLKMIEEVKVNNIPISCKNKKTKLMGIAPIYSTKRAAQKSSEKGEFQIFEFAFYK